jgi:hypothetical protein
MLGNGNKLGTTSEASIDEANGVWGIDQQYLYKLEESWPISASVYNYPTEVNEGETITFNLTLNGYPDGTYYYTLQGSVSTADLSPASLSGSFVVTNSVGSFSLTLVEDALTEGTETFVVSIRTTSISGQIIAVTDTITVLDTSSQLSGTVTASTTSINEGQSVTFDVSVSDNFTGTLYFSTNTVSGTITASDFTTALTGSFSLVDGVGSFTRTLANDFTTEGTESFSISVRSGSVAGAVIATSQAVSVSDTSPQLVATITPNKTSMTESDTVTFSVSVTQNFSGTLYYSIASVTGTVNQSDFSTTIPGSFTVTNGSGSIPLTTIPGYTTEGSESFTLSVRTTSTSGTIIGTSSAITITDSSPNLTGTFTASSSSVAEGSSVSFTASVSQNYSGTLYYTINQVSGTVNASDFTDGLTSGSFTVSNGSGSISKTLTYEPNSEGSESFTMSLRFGSTSGYVIATSGTVSITEVTLQRVIITSGSGSATVPSNLTQLISIECIGSGDDGDTFSRGGGGGAYAKITSLSGFTANATYYYHTGVKGASGQDTWVNKVFNIKPSSSSDGVAAARASGTTGGSSTNSVGTTRYSGGNGGTNLSGRGNGGGGAAGPLGAGQNGGSSATNSGGGGGGAGGGSSTAGTAGGATNGGNGGAGYLGTGGTTGTSGTGAAGTAGGGGAGGGSTTGSNGGAGGASSYWGTNIGPGGGGGGGGGAFATAGTNGGAGGLYGGGGGGEGTSAGTPGIGQTGLIVITYVA